MNEYNRIIGLKILSPRQKFLGSSLVNKTIFTGNCLAQIEFENGLLLTMYNLQRKEKEEKNDMC